MAEKFDFSQYLKKHHLTILGLILTALSLPFLPRFCSYMKAEEKATQPKETAKAEKIENLTTQVTPPQVLVKKPQTSHPITSTSLKKTTITPTISRGITIRNTENGKVYGNTVNGADEGYVSEGSKNIEFKDNKYTAPKK